MKTILISPKDQEEYRFISNLLKKLKISMKVVENGKKEDIALGILTEEVVKGEKVSRRKIEKIFCGK